MLLAVLESRDDGILIQCSGRACRGGDAAGGMAKRAEMQNQQNRITNPTQDAAPRPVWSAPQVTVVDAALTQADNSLGVDGGIYS